MMPAAGGAVVAGAGGCAVSRVPASARSPLVAKVVRVGGVLKIVINDEVFEPLAYRSYRPTPELVRGFAGTGLRLANVTHTGMLCTLDVPYSLFGEVWTGPRQFNWDNFDAQMEMFEANAPGAYYNVALQLDTRDWALKAHPDWSNCYWNLVEMAGHEPWRVEAAESLQEFLRQVEARYGDRVFAYSLLCGSSTEWYTNSQGRGRPEGLIRHHPLKEAAFRRWTADPEATLPSLERLHHTSHGNLRHPLADAEALRYWRFHHQIIGETILYFLGKAQEVLEHRKLLGLFYGYLTQLDGRRLLEEGHLGYEQVWRSPDLDLLYAPAKYGAPRSVNGASGYLLTVDSLDLHDKLVFQEVDHTTHIARDTVENGRKIPGGDTKLPDEFATRQVLRREFVLTRAKRTALWWFDFLGGNYASEEMMAMVAEFVRTQDRLRDVPMRSVAEIAVFGDVGSMFHPAATSPLATDLLVQPPDALARIGAPHDIYTFSDLTDPRLPWERYKLVVFLNIMLMTPEQRAFVREQVATGGRTVFWVYAPDYIQPDGFSTAGIRAVTGIQVVERPGDDSRVRLNSGEQLAFSRPVTPLFAIDDPAVEILGRYESDGVPAIARLAEADHTSVYSAVGHLSSSFWRQIAREAGVHIYYEGHSPIYVNSALFGVHWQGGEAGGEIRFPTAAPRRLEELFEGGETVVREGRCRLPGQAGVCSLYLRVPQETDGTRS
jgi:hypothetical protein